MDLSTREGRREQGQLIQKAVERASLSVEELAHRIGCSRALIYQYLSGTTLAQPDRLQQIAAETSVPLAHFYGADGDDGRRGRRGGDPEARLAERIAQLEQLADAQEAPPQWDALASTCERLVSLAGQSENEAGEARALLRLGRARCRMGEFSRAIESLRRAAELFAGLGDARGEAQARQALGHALLATGKTAEARDQFAWIAGEGPADNRWSGVVSLAGVFEQLGDYRQAMEKCDEAAALLEQSKRPAEAAHGMLYVNGNRANLYLACGDFDSARKLAEKCMGEAEALGNSDQHLEARLNLGVCDLYTGHWASAQRLLTSALQLARFLGDRSRESVARATLAMMLAALCDCDNCILQAKDALAAALSQGDHRAELFAQMALADAYFVLARDSEARYHANQALGVASALRLALYEAECRLRIGRLCLHADEPEDAREPIERGLKAAGRLGARAVEAEALTLRGELLLRAGDAPGAAESARAAVALACEIGAVPLQWEAESLLARAACATNPSDLDAALRATARAVDAMWQVRADLREAGIPDTVLEDRGRLAVHLLRARLLQETGGADAAEVFLEQAEWPPLTERFQEGQAVPSGGKRGARG